MEGGSAMPLNVLCLLYELACLIESQLFCGKHGCDLDSGV